MVILPRSRGTKSTEIAEINAQNTDVAMKSEMTAEARSWTTTPSVTPTRAPKTATPSPTLVLAPTDTPETGDGADATVDPRTATVAALFTEQAEKETSTPDGTGLPDTGIMDNVGVPGLVALAASLVLVIFLARRLRTGG